MTLKIPTQAEILARHKRSDFRKAIPLSPEDRAAAQKEAADKEEAAVENSEPTRELPASAFEGNMVMKLILGQH